MVVVVVVVDEGKTEEDMEVPPLELEAVVEAVEELVEVVLPPPLLLPLLPYSRRAFLEASESQLPEDDALAEEEEALPLTLVPLLLLLLFMELELLVTETLAETVDTVEEAAPDSSLL